MAVPPIPPPLAQLGGRPFSFYPAILNAGHNEWIYRSATWSEVLVCNTKTNEVVSVPRRYVGEISRVDAPVMIVGLLAELEYRSGAVWPGERRWAARPWLESDWRARATRVWGSWCWAVSLSAWRVAYWRSACFAAA